MNNRNLTSRRNFLALLGDNIGFGLSLTFANQTTILPDFARQLTDSRVIIGLLAAIISGAWLLPQIFYARFLTSKRRKKPFVILGATIGRFLYLPYAVGLLLGLARNPALALALMLTLQLVFLGSDALAAVAWFDMFAKAIPAERRGRLIGAGQAIRGVLAIAAGVLIAALLGAKGPPFPSNYAILFILAAAGLLFSFFCLTRVVEPDEPVEEANVPWREYLPALFQTLRQDAAFRRLIVVRLLAGFDTLALSFYILFALDQLKLAPGTVGLFTVVQTVGSILASLFFGWLGERAGNQRIIQVATALGLTAPLVGLALFFLRAPGSAAVTAIFAWAFLAGGAVLSASMLGFYNYILDLAPTRQRPTYIGLFNTVTGLLVPLPLLGGLLLQNTSYGVLFAATALGLLAATGLSLTLPSVHRIRGKGSELPR